MFRLLHVFVWIAAVANSTASCAEEPRCEKIISLAPSVTEVLFDLGLGARIIGATRFCRFPVQAQTIPRVGGLYDVSVEKIALSRPTNVFTLSESDHLTGPLSRVGIHTTVVEHRGVEGILESYLTIGRECGIGDQATARVSELRAAEREIQARCSKLQNTSRRQARVMVVVGRAKLGTSSSHIYISGRDGFYSEVLRLVGAVNVNSAQTVAVPSVSAEGILALNPDVILEVVNVDDGDSSYDRRAFWNRFARIPAVVNNRVFILEDDFASIPGPRYILLAKKLSSLLCDA